ncbi:uncharacterized protein LOC119989564 [Tripterygium wilfordii]|uniref:uncharacterized protein LOC119989564 n=1 Tax=Tripterygium wilfordii TaxID=458696 RepID=UPI0018F8249F|nr:uncharacterized protein LOC119989564 [Tripterygium wilfordii]
MASSNLSLKLLIDSKTSKVLFAEGGKDVVDFLCSILSLPVGTVIRLLKKQGMVGTLGNLYQSIEDLNDTYLQPDQSKDTLLMPKVANSATDLPLLLPNLQSTKANNLYRCNRNSYSNCRMYVSGDPTAVCPQCKYLMDTEATYVDKPNKGSSSAEGGYVKGVVTYMIMDDLAVKPMSTISSVTILNKFNVKDVGALEEKEVNLSMDEGLKLLKASLLTKTALTDVFLGQKESEVEYSLADLDCAD